MQREIARPKQDWLHWIFEASLAAKGLAAGIETLSGLVLLVLRDGLIVDLARKMTAHELSEDPGDLLANHLMQAAQNFPAGVQHFYALYFLSHGIVKLAVVGLLARGLLWAYPVSIAVLGLFILYQLHSYSHSHAAMMLVLSALDVLVIALTCREWRQARLKRRPLT